MLYGLRDTNSALAFLDGFITYYNFIRPHDGIDNKTPAEAASVKYDVKSWADVTHIGETKEIEIKPEYVIPPHIEAARLEMTGEPYKTGRNYDSHKGVNKSAILAEKKRQLKDKIRNRKRALEAKRKFEKEAETQARTSLSAASVYSPRKRRASK